MAITAKDCLPFKNGKGNAIQDASFKPLTQFVNSIKPISILELSSLPSDEESKLAYSPLENQPFPIKEGDEVKYQQVWQAGRYVGSTTIYGKTIEIEPRFGTIWLVSILEDLFHFKLTDSENQSGRGYLNKLMRIILWRLWLRKFAAADQYGLPRRVVKRVHQGLQIKGHLNVRKSLFPLFTKRQVVSEYREKEIDDTICRVVYKAYSILVNNKMNYVPEQIQDSLNSLYSFYQGQLISVSEHDYHDINYKSIYLSWKPLVDFSWQIIKQEIFNQQQKKEGESYSIFLDMAEIWEAYLRKKLGEGLKDQSWRVLSVEECTYMIYERKFYERKIIPDIILERENGGVKQYMVFDAKYKRMRGTKTSAKYSDVDRSDLFQIHTYIHYVQTHMGEVVLGGLLYPITQKGKNEDGTEYEINDIDIDKYHSERLFGGSAKDGDTRFIIDGILCPEKEEDEKPNKKESDDERKKRIEREKKEMEEFKKRTNAMIERIRNLIPKP